MKTSPEQLAQHLSQHRYPVYLLAGEEVAQRDDCLLQLRQQLQATGFTERQFFQVDAHFDWQQLIVAQQSPSLFCDQTCIELLCEHSKLGTAGAKILNEYVAHITADTVLVLVMGKLDPKQRQSQWFKAIDKVGLICQCWPLSGQALIDWLKQQAQPLGLDLPSDAFKLLAQSYDGNSLAAKQALIVLSLAFPETAPSLAEVRDAIARSTQYDVFALCDAVLHGRAQRSMMILDCLRSTGIDATIVLWALLRDMRLLYPFVVGQQPANDKHLQQQGVWQSRRTLVKQAITRLSAQQLQTAFRFAAEVDASIKGQLMANSWQQLQRLILLLLGMDLITLDVA